MSDMDCATFQFVQLPKEIQLTILYQCELQTLLTKGPLVCQEWRRILNDSIFWKIFVQRRGLQMPQSVLNLFEDLDIVDVKRLVWYRPFGSNLIRNCCGELQSSLDQSPEPDEDSSMDIVGWRIHSGEDGKHRWQVRDDNVTGLYTKERQSNLKYKSESPNAEQHLRRYYQLSRFSNSKSTFLRTQNLGLQGVSKLISIGFRHSFVIQKIGENPTYVAELFGHRDCPEVVEHSDNTRLVNFRLSRALWDNQSWRDYSFEASGLANLTEVTEFHHGGFDIRLAGTFLTATV